MTGVSTAEGARLWTAVEDWYRGVAQSRGTGQPVLHSLELTVPAADPVGVFGAFQTGPAVFWAEPSPVEGGLVEGGPRPIQLAFGAATVVHGVGPSRFSRVRTRLLSALRQLEAAHGVRTFGGFSFSSGSASEPAWDGYGDSTFVIPRWTLFLGNGKPRVVLVVVGDEGLGPLRQDFERLLAAFATGPITGAENQAEVVGSREPSPVHWERYVGALQAGMTAGRYDKVVAAQRTELVFSSTVDAARVLSRLLRRFPQTTVFAFRFGPSVFLGATPERLIRVFDGHYETEALAGTSSPARENAEATMLSSSKELGEHAYVVDDVRTRLGPLVASLEIAGPRVTRLPDVLHLQTTMTGECRSGADVLAFVEALHPTSAVGGVPRGEALRCIERLEAKPRGWYAGPVGWLDGAGQGSFWVALRSALVFERSAWLYAGAGIVRDSDASQEYEETKLKRAAMLDVLSGAKALPLDAPAGSSKPFRDAPASRPSVALSGPSSSNALSHEPTPQTYGSAR